ncbi:MAG: glutamine synthetase family protein [Candidatus Thorarchaeota archaeon]
MVKIEYIEFQFVDILGRLKAMTVPCKPAETLDEVREDPVLQSGTSIDGSSIIGLANVEASDLRLVPDIHTLIELPYTMPRIAAVMCFVKKKDLDPSVSKEYYARDTRGALHSFHDNEVPKNMYLRAKIEPEFHFVTMEGDPLDGGEYADTYPRNTSAEILMEISSAIRSVGMQPRVIHHEVGMAQQEIEIDFEESRKMADYILLFKNITRAVALTHDIGVTFMPKPFPRVAGNGMHCHLQLWEGDKNLFGADDGTSLSDTAEKFVAGLLEHAPAITAIANPSVNSYKRLVPHHEAPVYISWGPMNRTALVRVPLFSSSSKAAVEFRSADAMTNPYLLFTALMAAGLDGINSNLIPPEARTEDIFEMSDTERKQHGIKMLPPNLEAALTSLENDTVIRKAIGEPVVEEYLKIKRKEWIEYANYAVTDWEWESYGDL